MVKDFSHVQEELIPVPGNTKSVFCCVVSQILSLVILLL